jgi:hypothetical protein
MAITLLGGVRSVVQPIIHLKKIQTVRLAVLPKSIPDRGRQKKLLARAMAHTIIVLWRATHGDAVTGVIKKILRLR